MGKRGRGDRDGGKDRRAWGGRFLTFPKRRGGRERGGTRGIRRGGRGSNFVSFWRDIRRGRGPTFLSGGAGGTNTTAALFFLP